MIFVIFIVIGFILIIGTVWVSSASLRWAEHPVARGQEWYALSPEKIESGIANAIQTRFREILRVILKWAIVKYRETQQKITVKQEIKKRVRAFLYEHKHDGMRNPSKMWGQLRHDPKENPSEQSVISSDEITSSSE